MALSKIKSESIATNAVGPTQLNEGANYDFTGTVTGTSDIINLGSTTISTPVSQVAIDSSVITSDIKHLEVRFGDFTPSTTHGHLGFSTSTNNGSSFNAQYYARAYFNTFNTALPSWSIGGNIAGGFMLDDVKGTLDTLTGGNGILQIMNIQGSGTKFATVSSFTRNSHNSNWYGYFAHTRIDTTGSINYLKIIDYVESGNLETGRFDFYGYK